MKSILYISLLILFLSCGSNDKKTVYVIKLPDNLVLHTDKTEVLFESKEKVVDLTQQTMDTLIHFPFVNIGKYPLIITQAISSCGCTVTSYPKDSIFPNEINEIVLRFTPKSTHYEEITIQKSSVEIVGNFTDSVTFLKVMARIHPE